MKRTLTIITVLVVTFSTIFAEGFDHKRFGVDLKASFINSSAISNSAVVGNINVDSDVNGISGKILFNYYINANYSFFVSAGLIAAKNKSIVNFAEVSNESSAVTPLYFGAKYYLISLDDQTSILKPYLNAGVGIAIGAQSKSDILDVESTVESTPAAYIGAGADLELTSLLKLSFDVGYNLISKFDTPIGATRDYSGSEVSFGLGFNF